MKKNLFLSLAAVAAFGLSLVSCSDDPDGPAAVETTRFAVVLDMPLNVTDATLKQTTATLTNVATKETFTAENFKKVGEQYADTLTLPVGTYNIEVKGAVDYVMDDTLALTSNVRNAGENILVDKANTSTTLALNIYHAQDGLLITEIFFTGTLTPEGKQYSDDQYFKIGNNSDSTLYLDGLALVESEFLTVQKQDYTPDIMDHAMTIDAIYVFPGSGKDYPIAPGQEVVVAINAKNHTEFNSQSIDLSTADFEIYDESSNPRFTDDDNPNVPNLINWYDYSYTYFGLHNRGFKSYAIARPGVDQETFLNNYKYTYKYVFTYGEYSFDMDDEAYKLPNNWIIDAVNLSVESEFQWIVTSPSLDAGWAHCGSVDKDQNRYGKAVVRKKDGGKWLDTNNSTNDFESDAQPTLFK